MAASVDPYLTMTERQARAAGLGAEYDAALARARTSVSEGFCPAHGDRLDSERDWATIFGHELGGATASGSCVHAPILWSVKGEELLVTRLRPDGPLHWSTRPL